MTQQEHGCHAFQALLREAAAGTEIPMRAWRRRLGAIALKPVGWACPLAGQRAAGRLPAMAACGFGMRAGEAG